MHTAWGANNGTMSSRRADRTLSPPSLPSLTRPPFSCVRSAAAAPRRGDIFGRFQEHRSVGGVPEAPDAGRGCVRTPPRVAEKLLVRRGTWCAVCPTCVFCHVASVTHTPHQLLTHPHLSASLRHVFRAVSLFSCRVRVPVLTCLPLLPLPLHVWTTAPAPPRGQVTAKNPLLADTFWCKVCQWAANMTIAGRKGGRHRSSTTTTSGGGTAGAGSGGGDTKHRHRHR